MTKKNLIFLVFSFFLVASFKTKVLAKECCVAPWHYSDGSIPAETEGKCCSSQRGTVCIETNCDDEETCQNNNCVPKISVSPSPATEGCCPGGWTYKFSTNQCCINTPRGTACVAASSCAANIKESNILQPAACNKVCQELDPNTGGCIKWQGTGIETALGCFPTDTQGIIGWILNFGIGVGGGLAFLRGIWGVILMITSSGNPERLKEAQETLSSSIAGIVIIIFAVFLLRLIGVTILEIPGFG